MPPRLKPDAKAAIAAHIDSHRAEPIKSIARRFGIDYRTARKIKIDLGLSITNKRRRSRLENILAGGPQTDEEEQLARAHIEAAAAEIRARTLAHYAAVRVTIRDPKVTNLREFASFRSTRSRCLFRAAGG